MRIVCPQVCDLQIAQKYEWVKELKKKQLAFLEGLPFAVKVPSHKLIVVHAGLVPGTEVEKQVCGIPFCPVS